MRPVLVVMHAPHEGPGLIARGLDAPIRVRTVLDLDDARLPGLDEVSGVVVMGGPMDADDVPGHPGSGGGACAARRGGRRRRARARGVPRHAAPRPRARLPAAPARRHRDRVRAGRRRRRGPDAGCARRAADRAALALRHRRPAGRRHAPGLDGGDPGAGVPGGQRARAAVPPRARRRDARPVARPRRTWSATCPPRRSTRSARPAPSTCPGLVPAATKMFAAFGELVRARG